ncbi:MAG: hypothetical protein JXA08_08355 [Methanomicrobiaceae archaeon]|nr:hypothetical protein [Methanomicrobiaceae archaeon]
MQDHYVGDVGDFGKYGLLNTVLECGGGGVRLGVNWYYVKGPKQENGDGGYTGYLYPENKNWEKFERCFPEIYVKLKKIVEWKKNVDSNQGAIAAVERNEVIRGPVSYYSEPVNTPHLHHTRREEAREEWFAGSLVCLSDADIIFLDPDNGIQPDSLKKSHARAGKYFFRDECREYCAHGASLILYHHRNRKPKEEYGADIRKLHQAIDPSAKVFILRFTRFSVRDYIFIAQKEHEELFGRVIRELTSKPRDFLFEKYDYSPATPRM